MVLQKWSVIWWIELIQKDPKKYLSKRKQAQQRLNGMRDKLFPLVNSSCLWWFPSISINFQMIPICIHQFLDDSQGSTSVFRWFPYISINFSMIPIHLHQFLDDSHKSPSNPHSIHGQVFFPTYQFARSLRPKSPFQVRCHFLRRDGWIRYRYHFKNRLFGGTYLNFREYPI